MAKAAVRMKRPRQVRARASARTGMALPTGYGTLLLTLWIGTSIAALVMGTGLALLAGDEVDLRSLAVHDARAADADEPAAQAQDEPATHAHKDATAPGAVGIDITARHIGNLQLVIQASVSSSETGYPLDAPKVVAFTDMVQMPQAHASGPIAMKPLPGRPGVFAAKSAVPMPGDYKVTVRVKGPKSGTQTETVSVGTVQH